MGGNSSISRVGLRERLSGNGSTSHKLEVKQHGMLSYGAEISNFRFPGILLNLRLNIADDFFISPKNRNKSSSLSLSLSYIHSIKSTKPINQNTYLFEKDIDCKSYRAKVLSQSCQRILLLCIPLISCRIAVLKITATGL